MTQVEWAGLALATAALFLSMLAWGFWRPLRALWTIWFFLEGLALTVLGVLVATSRIARPEEQLIVVSALFLGVTIWHSIMVATPPLRK